MQEKDYDPAEMRRHRDTDGDGIPDFVDSRYSKPSDDYQYRRISEENFDKLREAGLDKAIQRKSEDGSLIIRYHKSQQAEINRVLRNVSHPVQKL